MTYIALHYLTLILLDLTKEKKEVMMIDMSVVCIKCREEIKKKHVCKTIEELFKEFEKSAKLDEVFFEEFNRLNRLYFPVPALLTDHDL